MARQADRMSDSPTALEIISKMDDLIRQLNTTLTAPETLQKVDQVIRQVNMTVDQMIKQVNVSLSPEVIANVHQVIRQVNESVVPVLFPILTNVTKKVNEDIAPVLVPLLSDVTKRVNQDVLPAVLAGVQQLTTDMSTKLDKSSKMVPIGKVDASQSSDLMEWINESGVFDAEDGGAAFQSADGRSQMQRAQLQLFKAQTPSLRLPPLLSTFNITAAQKALSRLELGAAGGGGGGAGGAGSPLGTAGPAKAPNATAASGADLERMMQSLQALSKALGKANATSGLSTVSSLSAGLQLLAANASRHVESNLRAVTGALSSVAQQGGPQNAQPVLGAAARQAVAGASGGSSGPCSLVPSYGKARQACYTAWAMKALLQSSVSSAAGCASARSGPEVQACVNKWAQEQQKVAASLVGSCLRVSPSNVQGCIDSWIKAQVKGAGPAQAQVKAASAKTHSHKGLRA